MEVAEMESHAATKPQILAMLESATEASTNRVMVP